jgi:hypothetical protein
MTLYTCYTDCQDVVNNSSVNVELASLLGGNTTLAAGVAAAAVSLTPVSTTGFSATGTFQLYILDGANSEIATASVSGGNLSVPAGVAVAHTAGVNLVSAGIAGNLADIILRASSDVENICGQGPDGGDRSLFQAVRSETFSGPTPRAVFDRDNQLIVRPYRFPVVSVASASIQFGANVPIGINTTYLVLPDGARQIIIPAAQQYALQGYLGVPFNYMPYPRAKPFYATLTYTGGPCAGQSLANVPYDIKEATTYIILDRLAFRSNTLGGTMFRRGDVMFQHAAHTRGGGGSGGGGDSLFRMQAREKLGRYIRDLY